MIVCRHQIGARQVIMGWAAHPRHHNRSEAGTAGVQHFKPFLKYY